MYGWVNAKIQTNHIVIYDDDQNDRRSREKIELLILPEFYLIHLVSCVTIEDTSVFPLK